MSTNTSYGLLKYSRSYPSEDAARLLAQPTSADSEWQHFANPTLHFLSEVIGPNGSLRSARVRIVWFPVRSEPHPAQGYIVLEDVDLLSFPLASSLSTIGPKAQSQSLPLKVVYRDCVVGFRYLHPHINSAGSPPTYRRFQISFTDPSTATQFVDSIRQICPCKASPPPATALARGMSAKPVNAAFPTFAKPSNTTNPPPTSFTVPVQPASSQTIVSNTRAFDDKVPSQWPSSQPPVIESSSRMPPITPKRSHTTLQDPPTLSPFQRVFQTPPFDPLTVSSSTTSHSRVPLQPTSKDGGSVPPSSPLVTQSFHEEYGSKDDDALNREITHRASQSTSAPPVSFAGPSPASQRITSIAPVESTTSFDPSRTPSMSNPSVSSRELRNRNSNDGSTSSSHPQSSVDLTRDLRAVKELYDMPKDQLERLVGEVIREPGFPLLLEKLDTMWKVKGFISSGHQS